MFHCQAASSRADLLASQDGIGPVSPSKRGTGGVVARARGHRRNNLVVAG